MALLVLLICLGLQRFLQLHRYAYQISNLSHYYKWLLEKMNSITRLHGIFGVLLLISPLLIIVSFVYYLTDYWFGLTAEYIFSMILLWFCLDGRDLYHAPYASNTAVDLFIITYERLFAVIFWYVVLVYLHLLPAVIIYPMLISLRDYLQAEHPELRQLIKWNAFLLGLLDWIPIRLTGLSYALVGQFSSVFIPWCQELNAEIRNNQQQIAEWGFAALGFNLASSIEQGEFAEIKPNDAIVLINRVLVLWLIIIALFTLGILLG